MGFILLLGLCLRLGWGARQSSDPRSFENLPDQREYLELGRHLLNHQELWFIDTRFGEVVQAYRTPGYPAFIALCGAKPQIIRIVQALLDVSTILAVWILSRRWLPPLACPFAVALVALDPYLIYFTGTILSETLFTALLCWGIVLLVISEGPWPHDRRRLTAWLGGGLLLGLSVLVRPGAIGLPVVLGCGAALLNRQRSGAYRLRWPLPVAATMILLTALVLFPWAVRNRFVLHSWIWTSTNSGITTYDGFNPDANGASDQAFVKWMPWTREMSEVGRSQYFSQLADDWMHAHPLEAIELSGTKIIRTWSPIPLSDEYGSHRAYVLIGLLYGSAFFMLVLAGLWFGDVPRPVKWFLLMPAAYLTVAAALSVGSLRYRIPAQPPMAIVAASVLCRRTHSLM